MNMQLKTIIALISPVSFSENNIHYIDQRDQTLQALFWVGEIDPMIDVQVRRHLKEWKTSFGILGQNMAHDKKANKSILTSQKTKKNITEAK